MAFTDTQLIHPCMLGGRVRAAKGLCIVMYINGPMVRNDHVGQAAYALRREVRTWAR